MTPIRTLRPLAKVVLSTQSDERLVALSREGSEDAFAEIVRRHRPGLLRLARSLGSGDRADDVVQDGLVRAWRALRRSDAEIDLRPWLATIVRNRALTAHSTNRQHDELDETIDGVRQPGDIVIMREELRSAVSAVNSLPDTQREALVRSALAGESHDQIASALATTPGAVRQLIFRARTGLREAVGAVVPFPLVRALADIGVGGAAVGAGAAAATAGGASFGIKALAVVVVGATVAGSGVAIERRTGGAEARETARTTADAGHPTQPGDRTTVADGSAPDAGDSAPPGTTGDTEAVLLKDSKATRSAQLSTSDSRESGEPRIVSAPSATPADGDEHAGQAPPASNHQTQQPSRGPESGQHGGPRPGGNHGPRDGAQQQPPPAPQGQAPTSDQAATYGGGDGRHHGPRGGQQTLQGGASGGHYGSRNAADLGDLITP